MVSYPGDWEIVTVKEVADINTGRRNTQDNKPHGKYKFFVRSPIVERIDVADYDCEAVLTAGDGNVGKVFHYVNGKFSAHQRVYIINNFRNISGRFFYYYFSRYFIDEVRKYTAKSTVDSVRRHMIADMLIPLPPLKEQTAIANTLAAFDTHITNLTEQISKKKAIRDGALDDLMTGRTRLKGFCGDWEVKTLGEIASIQDGTHGTFIRVKLGKLLLSAKNVFDNHLMVTDNESMISQADYNKIISNGYPRIGDILMSCVGTIGRCCLLDRDDIAFQRSVAFIRPHTLYNKYLMFLLQSRNVQKQLASLTNASAQGGIYLNAIKHITLLLTPDKDEQIAISDTLTALDTEILSLETERAKISQIRDGAMNELLTGKVRLKIGI